MREMNAQAVSIKMIDGTIFRGYINIGSCRRLSDFFRRSDASPFVVMFETNIGENREKTVYFLNWAHILWVEPREPEGPPSLCDSVALERQPG